MKISVTQEDIDNGVKDDPCFCPIALACVRAGIVEEFQANVSKSFIETKDGWARTPAVASEFIYKFDDGEPVEPFEFEIPYPES